MKSGGSAELGMHVCAGEPSASFQPAATARASDDERHMGSEAGRGLMMDGDNQQPTNL